MRTQKPQYLRREWEAVYRDLRRVSRQRDEPESRARILSLAKRLLKVDADLDAANAAAKGAA